MAKTRHVIEAQDNVTPALNKISKALDKTQRDFDKATKVMETAGKALAGFFAAGKVAEFGKEAFTAFAKREVVVNRFSESMKRLGMDTESTLKKFDDLGTKLERAAGRELMDADVIVNLASQYMTLGRSAEEVEKLLTVAADLSALTGKDITTSMTMLTKADEGQIKALRMLVPELKNMTDAQIANGEAVDVVASKVEGMADRIYTGAIGSINALRESWDTLLETVGQNITAAPWLDTLTAQVDNFSEALNIATRQQLAFKSIQKNNDLKTVEGVQNAMEMARADLEYINNAQTGGQWNNNSAEFRAMESRVGKTLSILGITTEGHLKEAQKILQDRLIGLARDLDRMGGRDRNATPQSKPTTPMSPGAGASGGAGSSNSSSLFMSLGPGVNEHYGDVVDSGYDYLAVLEDQHQEAVDWYEALQEEWNKTDEAQADYWKTFKDGLDYLSTGVQALEGFYGTWMDLQLQQEEAAVESMQRQVKTMEDAYTAQLKTKRELGEDTAAFEQENAVKIAQAREALDAREREQKRKAWEANKQAQLYNAIMGTANATVNALGMFPFTPANLAMAALVGGLGAAQVGMIASQPTPEFAVGTPRVPRDMGAIVHQGEMIIPQTFAEGLRRGDLTLGRGGGPTVQINLSGAVYGSLEGMTKEINRELRRLSREGKL